MALNKNHLTLGVVLVALACAVGLYIWHNSNKSILNDGPLQTVEDAGEAIEQKVEATVGAVAPQADPQNSAGMVQGAGGSGAGGDEAPVGEGAQTMKSMDAEAEQLRQAACFPREQLMPEELLPQDNSSTWAQVNPQGQGSLADKSFLQSGWASGIDTVGSSMRNASWDLRSEMPNPQVAVSPWLNSTINPDTSRKPFEISGCT